MSVCNQRPMILEWYHGIHHYFYSGFFTHCFAISTESEAIVCSGHQQWTVQTDSIPMLTLVKLSLPSSARRSCHSCTSRCASRLLAVFKHLSNSHSCAVYVLILIIPITFVGI